MSLAALSPVEQVQPLAPGQSINAVPQAIELAQKEQIFSMLMQNTQSTLLTQSLQSLQAPRDDDEDEGW